MVVAAAAAVVVAAVVATAGPPVRGTLGNPFGVAPKIELRAALVLVLAENEISNAVVLLHHLFA